MHRSCIGTSEKPAEVESKSQTIQAIAWAPSSGYSFHIHCIYQVKKENKNTLQIVSLLTRRPNRAMTFKTENLSDMVQIHVKDTIPQEQLEHFLMESVEELNKEVLRIKNEFKDAKCLYEWSGKRSQLFSQAGVAESKDRAADKRTKNTIILGETDDVRSRYCERCY